MSTQRIDQQNALRRDCNGIVIEPDFKKLLVITVLIRTIRVITVLTENNQTWPCHYVSVSVHIKFSQKTSVFTLLIICSP